ncbi:MAG: tRNA pseudouridine(38-40) synthase TruA [Acutalibacteraceae bacterium]|nr:tRNA pseudouridine(38-40) synthase TruA [Acutalibacteraceae bacterium]
MQRDVRNNTEIRNFLVTISYNGSKYHGWQIQNNAVTVQEVFQQSLEQVIQSTPYELKGCSRTDSGVHANMYCISLKMCHNIPCHRLLTALNRFLPSDIAVMNVEEKPLDFHARYSCKSKEYVYKIWNSQVRNPFLNDLAYHYKYPIDVELLDKACKAYIGKHDYTSFCTLDNRKMEDMERTVMNFTVRREGDMVLLTVEADGFLYNMVRIMVGTLISIAQGKLSPDCISDIINAKDRTQAGPTAPACGLYLNRVKY